jgi:hypothetical protein
MTIQSAWPVGPRPPRSTTLCRRGAGADLGFWGMNVDTAERAAAVKHSRGVDYAGTGCHWILCIRKQGGGVHVDYDCCVAAPLRKALPLRSFKTLAAVLALPAIY